MFPMGIDSNGRRRRLKRSVQAAIGFCLLGIVLLVTGAITRSAQQRELEAMTWVAETHAVLTSIRGVHAAFLQAESAQRGYLMTEDAAFLAPFATSKRHALASLDRLAERVAGAPAEEARLAGVKRTLAARFAILDQTIALARHGRRDQAIRIVRSGSGFALSQQVVKALDAMADKETRLLAMREAQAAKSRKMNNLSAAGLGSAMLLGLFLSAWFYRREARHRTVAEAVLRETLLDAQQARSMAESATRAKSVFLAVMSHELRTPMTGVLGLIDLLQSNPPPEERDRYFEALRESANNLMDVLNDILDFSKIEAGKLELETVDFDLRDMARSVVDLFSLSASRKGLVLELVTTGASASHAVRGDPNRLRQVLSNLVSNAIKFTESGRISLVLTPPADGSDQGRWRIAVTDTGIGIDPSTQARLFQPFTQADASTTRRFGGTGLGLSISRRLIEAMDGELGVESRPGAGSTFWIDVPLAPAERAEALSTGRRARATGAPGRPLRVLVAEDNRINQLLLSGALNRMGHRVTCVDDGRKAVEAVAIEMFDVVLMDMQMPEMDGREATLAIRALGSRASRLPIIALTADAAPENRITYEGIGLSRFLTKPVDFAELSIAMSEVTTTIPAGTTETEVFGPGPPPAPTDAAFDATRLAGLRATMGDESIEELLAALVEDIAQGIVQIRATLGQRDFEGARRVAHAVRGAAANVAAIRLAESMGRLESGLRKGEYSESLLSDVEATFAVTQHAIHAMGGARGNTQSGED